MSKYSVILFDMDGTIANTDEMIVQTFLELYKLYRKGAPTPREQIYYFSGPPIREVLKREFPDQDNQFMWDEFHRISWDFYPLYTTGYPNCREVLLELKKRGYKLGVVTNKIHRTTLYCLKITNRHLKKEVFIIINYMIYYTIKSTASQYFIKYCITLY